MRIPRYQYTQGTALSARSTPVLRRDPSLQPNVLRKPIYRDPEAGKANMGLEVEAAGRGQYVINALSKGASDFTNILLKIETEQTATQAYYDLKSKAETDLSKMKDESISRPVNVLNPDGTINENLIPTYKYSAKKFQDDLLDERKRIAATLNRTASNAFARSSIDVMMSANAQAAAYNRKQAIAWTEGAAWKTLMAARTHEDVEDIAVLDFFKSSMGPLKFEKMVYERHRGIAADEIKAAIYKARVEGDEIQFDLIRRALMGKGEYTYKDPKTGEMVVAFDEEYAYLKYGVGGDDEKLFSIMDGYEAAIKKERNEFFDAQVTHQLAEYLKDKDTWLIKDEYLNMGQSADSYGEGSLYDSPLDKLDALLDKGIIDADGYTTLKSAIIAEETGPQYSQPGIYGEILENIGEYSFDDISTANITTTQKNQLTGIKIQYDRDTSKWASANNPAGGEGHLGIQLLKSHYGISVAGIASSMDQSLRKQQSEGWALAEKQLHLYMMGRIPNEWDGKHLDVPDDQKPMAAFTWVMHHLEARTNPDGTPKDQSLTGTGGDQTLGRFGLPPTKLSNLERFEADHLNGQTLDEYLRTAQPEAIAGVLQALKEAPFKIQISDEELEKVGIEKTWAEMIDDPSLWKKIIDGNPLLRVFQND